MSIRRKMMKMESFRKSADSAVSAAPDAILLPTTSDLPSTSVISVSSELAANTNISDSPVVPIIQNSDQSLVNNSDLSLVQNSDMSLVKQSNQPLAQNLNVPMVPLSTSSPYISAHRKYSSFRSSRYKATVRSEITQLPAVPLFPVIKPVEEKKLIMKRLAYLHTGICTERLPNQYNSSTDLCHSLDIHVCKDMTRPDRPIIQFFKNNRVINICGLNDNGSNSTTKEKNKLVKFIHSTAVNLNEIKWVHGDQNLNSIEKRKSTFEKCNVISPENVNKLCEAGFYYIGDGTTEETKCFCCAQRVLYWGNSVKPWTTHAIISKDCYYMALCKGKYYVNKVYNNYQHIQNYCETNYFEQLINIKKDEDSFDEIATIPNYSDSEDEPLSNSCTKVKGKPLTERLHTTVATNNTIEPVLQCKICSEDMINVLFIPCGHLVACIQCSLTLRHCPLCAHLFNYSTYFLRVFIVLTDVDVKKNDIVFHKTDINYIKNSKTEQTLCKMCQQNAMVVYVPCRHLFSCSECTLTLNNSCPVCKVELIGMIQTAIMS